MPVGVELNGLLPGRGPGRWPPRGGAGLGPPPGRVPPCCPPWRGPPPCGPPRPPPCGPPRPPCGTGGTGRGAAGRPVPGGAVAPPAPPVPPGAAGPAGAAGPEPGRPEPGACGTGRGAGGAGLGAAAAGAAASGISARPPGAAPPADGVPAAGLTGEGAPATGALAEGAAGAGAAGAGAPGRPAPRLPRPSCCPPPAGGAASGRPVPRRGGDGTAGAARPACWPCACLAPSGPKASLSLRTTGASIVEDADRTNSPISWSLTMTALLSTPNSFASSYTRTFATTLLYSARISGPSTRTHHTGPGQSVLRAGVSLWSSSPCAHRALIAVSTRFPDRLPFLPSLCPVPAQRRPEDVTSPGGNVQNRCGPGYPPLCYA
jgi:hypothetical protein